MQPDRPAEALTLADLSATTGIPGRTIRFYIAQGLMDGPDTAGRTSRYAPRHLERLQAIQAAKQQGMTLGEIRRRLAGPVEEPTSPSPAPVEVYTLSPDVTVLLRTDVPARRLQRVREALAAFADAITTDDHDAATPRPSAEPTTRTHETKENT